MTLPKSEVAFKWVEYFIISFYLHCDMPLMKKEIDEPNPPFCYLLSMLFLLPISWNPPQRGRGIGLGFMVWGSGVDIKIIVVYQKTLSLPCQQNSTFFQLLLTMFNSLLYSYCDAKWIWPEIVLESELFFTYTLIESGRYSLKAVMNSLSQVILEQKILEKVVWYWIIHYWSMVSFM